MFKKYIGMSPSAYRNSYVKAHGDESDDDKPQT